MCACVRACVCVGVCVCVGGWGGGGLFYVVVGVVLLGFLFVFSFFQISLESGRENTGNKEFNRSSFLHILATTAREITW